MFAGYAVDDVVMCNHATYPHTLYAHYGGG